MGWLALASIAAIAMGALVALRVPRHLWSFVGSALMLGAAGYALQGYPGVTAHPAAGDVRAEPLDPGMIDLRDRMFGRYFSDGAYMVAADALTRAGEPAAAIQAILGGIRAIPRSTMLWTGLGNAFVAHDGGAVSPAAAFAFDQAMRLAPRHPGPPFFAGMAYFRSGDFAKAQRLWERALRLSPAGTSYRRDIVARLTLLDRYLAAIRRQPQPH